MSIFLPAFFQCDKLNIIEFMEKKIARLDKALAILFYIILFLVPIAVWPTTFELFEFNKMWIVFMMTIVIAFVWITKIIISGKFAIKRTPLDIPILIFVSSQIFSTIFSIDPYVSFWGYYSRFNGGLLSILSYALLYFAFTNNLSGIDTSGQRKISYKMILATTATGIVVAFWGLPSHFGYDPTCLVFRGNFDVSCWTDAFQPKIRMFSTLGQPNWLAAYLDIIIPLVLSVFLIKILNKYPLKNGQKNFNIKSYKPDLDWKNHSDNKKKNILLKAALIFLLIIFYLDLTFSDSQSGFIAFWTSMILFILSYIFIKVKQVKSEFRKLFNDTILRIITLSALTFLIISFFLGQPIPRLSKFTFSSITKSFEAKTTNTNSSKAKIVTSNSPPPTGELGGTDSGKIRLIVWRGAIEIFKNNPIFGTGLETFAYSYYKYRPVEHNMTSEWDYLYNKAHNEYLNYLATSGSFGFLSYLSIIIIFLYTAAKSILKYSEIDEKKIIGLGIIAAFVSILVSNFFGFSVVIINVYFFLLPAMFYDLKPDKKTPSEVKNYNTDQVGNINNQEVNSAKIVFILIIGLIFLYFEFLLVRFWFADQSYALGYNYDRVGEYTKALEPLTQAVNQRPEEDLYKDELSSNLSTLALLLYQQKQASEAGQFMTQAKDLSDQVVADHPNNVVYFKTRTRVMYALTQIDPSYMKYTLDAIEKANNLAPTDVKISYNMGLLYSQSGDNNKAIDTLKTTIKLKPDYRDAHYALALIYIEIAKQQEKIGYALALQTKELAREQLEYILQNISKNDTSAKALLDSIK